MPSIISPSALPKLFLKVQFGEVIRKVEVAHHPAPNWPKLSRAILSRFDIPNERSIGLRYLDPDGDSITLSSQLEFDELWDEIKIGAKSKQKSGSDLKHVKLELVLLDRQSPRPKVFSHPKSDVTLPPAHGFPQASLEPEPPLIGNSIDPQVGLSAAHADCPDRSGDFQAPFTSYSHAKREQAQSAPDLVPDPGDFAIEDSPSQPPQNEPYPSSAMGNLSALVAAVDAMVPLRPQTLGYFARTMCHVTNQLSDACRVIADCLQEPSTHLPNPSHSRTQGNEHSSAPTTRHPLAPSPVHGSLAELQHPVEPEALPFVSPTPRGFIPSRNSSGPSIQSGHLGSFGRQGITPPVTAFERTPSVTAFGRTPPVAALERTPPVTALGRASPVTALERTTPVTAFGRTTPGTVFGSPAPDPSQKPRAKLFSTAWPTSPKSETQEGKPDRARDPIGLPLTAHPASGHNPIFGADISSGQTSKWPNYSWRSLEPSSNLSGNPSKEHHSQRSLWR